MKKVILLILSGIAVYGCARHSSSARHVTQVAYSGQYSPVSGRLSDGTAVTGVAWFYENQPFGKFCLQAGEVVCSGTYASRRDQKIMGEMECSNYIQGKIQATQPLDSGPYEPMLATGYLSDGRTIKAELGPKERSGSGTTYCYN